MSGGSRLVHSVCPSSWYRTHAHKVMGIVIGPRRRHRVSYFLELCSCSNSTRHSLSQSPYHSNTLQPSSVLYRSIYLFNDAGFGRLYLITLTCFSLALCLCVHIDRFWYTVRVKRRKETDSVSLFRSLLCVHKTNGRTDGRTNERRRRF